MGSDRAAHFLEPTLSKARRQRSLREQAAVQVSSPETSESDFSDFSKGKTDSQKTGSLEQCQEKKSKGRTTFKAATKAVMSLTHPLHMPRYQGGEGVRRLVETRERGDKILFMSVEYWDTIFCFDGRAWPMLPQVLYCIFSTVVTCIIINLVPNYENVGELAALQFPTSTLGTNSSYDRWWEGRKLWDGMQSKIQDTARMALVWVGPLDKEAASGLIRYSLTFAYVAKKMLRVEQGYEELGGILSQEQITELDESIDPATDVAERLTHCVSAAAQANLSPALFSGLDANIRGMQADLSAMSRIASTPMPFAYIVHLRSFMVLWLAGLPFAFVQTLKYWSILICFVVGYQLLGTETIGVEVENPFGRDFNDLPLDQITNDMYVRLASVLARLGQQVDIQPAITAAEESAAEKHYDGGCDDGCE